MGGQLPLSKFPGALVKAIKKQNAAGKPDLSVDGKSAVEQSKQQFGVTNLGESQSIGSDPVEFTGTTPRNRKKPTITLLGEKP